LRSAALAASGGRVYRFYLVTIIVVRTSTIIVVASSFLRKGS
jgi:hypothetical protein